MSENMKERAEAAEAELEAVREDNHAMMLEIDGMRTEMTKLRAAPAIPADHNIEKETPDCRACANRGRINGLSQESYCDSCVYQGRSWRKNHFVDASKMVDAKGFRASTKDSGCVK